MNEELIIWNLVSGKIGSFSSKVNGFIKEFYRNYDPTKSLDKSFLLELVSRVHNELDCIVFELENEVKKNG